jgi:hypothetical protein
MKYSTHRPAVNTLSKEETLKGKQIESAYTVPSAG